jgi:BlaI family transcriptional regulator, penicillinase repressor
MARPLKHRSSSSPEPTAAELHLLRVLWQRGGATVREVWEQLGGKGSYTTVLKQFQIMLEKGLVKRDDTDRAHIFHAAVPEKKVQHSALRRLLDSLFEGSAAQLVTGALAAKKVSAAERGEIRRMLDELDKKEGKS